MKSVFIGLSFLLTTSFGFASQNCANESRLASFEPTVIDRLQLGAISMTEALAEAQLHQQAGAECTEVSESDSLYIVKAYYPIATGPEKGKLIQTINLLRKQ